MKKRNDRIKQDVYSFLIILSLALLALTQSGCGGGGTGTGNPMIEDNSTSGVVASAVGGALSSSSTNNSLAMNSFSHRKTHESFSLIPSAMASTACPTYHSASGSGCHTTGGDMYLTYADCSFGSSQTNWDAVQAFIMSTGTASCGTFPSPGANATLNLQYVTLLTHAPSTALLTTDYGTLSTIDDNSTNLSNFDGDTIAPIINSGYGAQVGYDSSGKKNSLIIEHHISDIFLDHTLNGSLGISEITSSSRNVTGQVTVYHNRLKVVGTSVLNSLVHDDSCCLPISGSIKTTFAAGSNVADPPTTAGALLVNKSETLTFTGCRTATYQSYDGTTTNVSLSRCF